MTNAAPDPYAVDTLGQARVPTPLRNRGHRARFVAPGTRVRLDVLVGDGHGDGDAPVVGLEKAGPREQLYFDPAQTTAAIVTCGGLAPGLNNVIRSVFMELTYNYGVPRLLGIRDGYRGLDPQVGRPPIELDKRSVKAIQDRGGTLLGTSRGPQDPVHMVDFLEAQEIDVLFCVGGDGTQRGAHRLTQEITRRGLSKAVVGIPKTIDNDIPYVWLSFGYMTALSEAEGVLRAAHVEARCAPHGVGLVKLMGRDAGFIAAGAAVASQEANFVLVPEVPFPLDGFLDALLQRVADHGHALVVVAEGAGQHLFGEGGRGLDASGNALHEDIGRFLDQAIRRRFQEAGVELNLKYFDPSYLIRSVPANGWDRVLSDRMARNAVHAAMAGCTDVLIGSHQGMLVHVPIDVATAERKHMDPEGDLWSAVQSATGQPCWP